MPLPMRSRIILTKREGTFMSEAHDEHAHEHVPSSNRRRITEVGAAIEFMQGGEATVTLKSLATDQHYTYKIGESEDGHVFFVAVMFGSDNESDYAYIGIIKDGAFLHTKKSKVTRDDKRWRAFDYVYRALSDGRM